MNLHTLHIEHTTLLAVYTLLTLANARLQRGMRGVRYFELYSILALLGSLAVMLRGGIPNVISIVGGDLCVLAAYAALHKSMARLFGLRREHMVLVLVWLTLGCAAIAWWGSVRPDTPTRLLAYSILIGVEQVSLGTILLSGGPERRKVSWTLAVTLLGLAAVNTVRTGAALTGSVPQDYLRAGPVLAAVVLANTALQCGVMVAYVWMTAAMLRSDLEMRASTDPLTGLPNRRTLETAAALAIRAVERGKGVFAVVVLDLDRYKPLNDRLGHAAGDQALRQVTGCLQRELRVTDILARSGGDEFVVLLPRTDGNEAREIAHRLRGSLEELDLELADASARITGSFGVAEAVAGETWEDLLARCDGALYAAKRNGGNSVCCHTPAEQLEMERMFSNHS